MSASRPVVALSMRAPVADLLFAESWDRLERVARLVSRTPLSSLTDPAVMADVEVLLTGWGVPGVDEAVLAAAPRLRAIVHAAGTVKGFVGQACWDHGVLVTSVAAANAQPVAEFTVAAITLANKGAFLASARYRADHRGVPWTMPAWPTFEVGNRGKGIGLVGASKVGRMVIELLRPFENEVVVADPLLGVDEAAALGVSLVELDSLLATCDVVSLHAPLLPETVGMIDRRRLGLLKDGAVFINTARGAIVDGAALEDELASGRISAVIDTTDPEPLPDSSRLYDLPNVFLTPHIAGSMGTELARLASSAIDELERYARGEPFAWNITKADLPWIA